VVVRLAVGEGREPRTVGYRHPAAPGDDETLFAEPREFAGDCGPGQPDRLSEISLRERAEITRT
jgi:hypothetical protein